jgi:uncharacterized protein
MSAEDVRPVVATIDWRRLDVEGRDRCCLEQTDDGWRLRGEAIFTEGTAAARLAYDVRCDHRWLTSGGTVTGTIGARRFDVRIERRAGGWVMNAAAAAIAGDCVDLDLGFTPATNLIQLRRLALAVGAAADAPVAWLDVGSTSLDRIDQRYERRSEHHYWYESPRFDYAALLAVRSDGFITSYPNLWAAIDE